MDKEFHTVTQPAISIFFPAYNDAGTIASMVVAARIAARQLTHDFEILVVNDGSRDHTAEVLGELERIIPELRVVQHTRNRGYGGALRTGFASASKDLIFYTDGDAQYDPRELRALVERMDEGVDFVNGYKMGRSDPLHRVLIGRIYHWTVRLAFGLRLRDVDCDFRLFRKSILDRVELTKSSGVICVELMKKVQDAGFRILEVPVHHYHRAYGKSQFFNFRRVGRTLYDLIRLWVDLVIRRVHLRPRSAPASTEESARDGQSLVS
ncbi:MAG TPA: glycosyltransferase family 2 protein [Vicinamibacteria bacterium]|nr:glycosyltransferase family 2 protein [Vicinamibacteria bacterium]